MPFDVVVQFTQAALQGGAGGEQGILGLFLSHLAHQGVEIECHGGASVQSFGDDPIDALFDREAKASPEEDAQRGGRATTPNGRRSGRYVDVNITVVMLRPYLCDPRLVSH